MSDVIQLRPEVLELVREIAQRPDSVLLRVKPGTEMRALREDRAWLTGSESSLSRAERHLVDVYREEVAFALRQVAWARLCAVKASQGGVMRRQSVRSECALVDDRSATLALAKATRDFGAARGEIDPDVLVGALLDPRTARFPSVISICAASHRLSPSFRARHMCATWYGLYSRTAPALLAAGPALTTAKDGIEESLTYTLVSDLAAQRGEWGRARDASVQAVERFPELIAPYVALAWSAVQMCEFDAAENALRDLDRVIGSDTEALADHTRRYEQLAGSFGRSLQPNARSVLRRVVDGPVRLGKELFHAVL